MYVTARTSAGGAGTLLTYWPAGRFDPDPRRRIGAGAREAAAEKEQVMSLGTILLIILVLMLLGVLPTWPHARSWGYGPSGIVGVVLVIVIVLFQMGRL
jgi:hypothetical protein